MEHHRTATSGQQDYHRSPVPRQQDHEVHTPPQGDGHEIFTPKQRDYQITSWLVWIQQFRILQGVVAAAKTAFAMVLLGVATPLASVVVALVSFAVYTANDLADREEDAINCPDRESVVAEHPMRVAALALTSLIAGAGLAFVAGGPDTLAVSLIPIGACLLYSLPVTPSGRRLKDVFVLNTALVAGAWAVTVTLVPLTIANAGFDSLAAAVVFFFFLRSFVSVEVFNVRDVAGDEAAGVATLPVVFGLGRTKLVLGVLHCCSLAVLIAFTTIPHASQFALFALPVVSYALSITWFLDQTSSTDMLCLATDGEYLMFGLIALQFAA